MKLSAVNLKSVLWDTLLSVKNGKIEPGAADAVAAQAREILRTTNTQMSIIGKVKAEVTQELREFAMDKAEG